MRRYADGEIAKALAEEYGVARNSVLNLLRENNVVARRQPPTLEQQALLAREYEAGAPSPGSLLDTGTRMERSDGR